LLKSLKVRGEQLQRTDVEPASNEEVPLVLKHSETDSETLVETPARTSKPRKLNSSIVVALIGVVGTIIAALLGSPLIEKWFAPVPFTSTVTVTTPADVTPTQDDPSFTDTPSSTPTETMIPLPTVPIVFNPQSDVSDYFDSLGVPMRLISSGEFMMGRNSPYHDAQIHKVHLKSFYIDKYEVTNALYKACYDVGRCESPKRLDSKNRSNYYSDDKFANFPVIYVDWNMATAYCEWRNGRLPTEAEWEKAARGNTQSDYPWGNSLDHNYANYGQDITQGDTKEIGSYRNDRSPYGVYDLAGNVWEWVSDWYSETYYANSPTENPTGPESGKYHVVRGGSWANTEYSLLSAERYKLRTIPEDTDFIDLGFRCAKDAP